MVAGHYQPLADNGARAAMHTVRPNLSSAVGSEDKDKQTYMRLVPAYFKGHPDLLVFGL
jgi:hypothetical protein